MLAFKYLNDGFRASNRPSVTNILGFDLTGTFLNRARHSDRPVDHSDRPSQKFERQNRERTRRADSGSVSYSSSQAGKWAPSTRILSQHRKLP
jgi:hypothetical protein